MNPAWALAALGLVDAAFSGFRAYAGRDARIRKHRAVVHAALRGLSVGAVLLLAPAFTAGAVLLLAEDPDRAYGALADGGVGFLVPLGAYALAVLFSLAAYLALPFRASTLAVVVGLGPLTLARPLVVAAACAGALVAGGGWTSLLVGAVAGAAVLCVEPYVHRRWYAPAY
ncbi:hypothetical protein OG898_18955 [Streptomyces sp. NBC_00193]|uniref:hypothetical protein n=1 Tax=unclassified Streptomyces TaxID=2593676 RepID=UPI00225269B4|nr:MULTISPECIES: hypothetical protein [unclassified Streptomyces]MCX5125655.1 hypothetical protein [Streptomyces sp. NBC_00347]MCX5298539.1 hypothetical protein [Streptomyces sp. NBC_00193]